MLREQFRGPGANDVGPTFVSALNLFQYFILNRRRGKLPAEQLAKTFGNSALRFGVEFLVEHLGHRRQTCKEPESLLLCTESDGRDKVVPGSGGNHDGL
jgi:hypothetical protein